LEEETAATVAAVPAGATAADRRHIVEVIVAMVNRNS
jgi:hypothetical protein